MVLTLIRHAGFAKAEAEALSWPEAEAWLASAAELAKMSEQ